jgi:hypothetical protein
MSVFAVFKSSLCTESLGCSRLVCGVCCACCGGAWLLVWCSPFLCGGRCVFCCCFFWSVLSLVLLQRPELTQSPTPTEYAECLTVCRARRAHRPTSLPLRRRPHQPAVRRVRVCVCVCVCVCVSLLLHGLFVSCSTCARSTLLVLSSLLILICVLLTALEQQQRRSLRVSRLR